MKYIILLFSIVTFALSNNLNLSKEEEQFLKTHPIIKSHNDQSYMPFNFLADDKAKGYTIDILNLIAKKLDIKIEYIKGYSWAEYLKMIKNKEIDIIGNILVNDQRKKFLNFTKPILIHSTSIISRYDFQITDLKQLENRTIAVVKGWWHEDALKKEFPKIKLLLVDEPIDALKAVSNKQADATLNSGASAQYLWKEHNIINLTLSADANLLADKTPIEHIGIRKDWPLLITAFNKAMNSITYEEKEQIKQKWFGTNNQEIKLSNEERKYLNSKEYLSVMSLDSFQPFSFRKDDKPYGYSIDIINEIGKILNKEIKFIKKPWNEQLQMLKEGKLDIIPHIAITNERKKFTLYTDFNHITFMIGFATQKRDKLNSMSDLENKTLAVVKGYYLHKHIERKFPNIKLLLADSTQEAVNAVSQGKAYAVIDNIPTLSYFIDEKWLSNLSIKSVNDLGLPLETNMPMGVAKKNNILKSILEKANSAIKDDKKQLLKQKWINSDNIIDKNKLTKSEKKFIENNPVIEVVVRTSRPPFEFERDGVASGIAVDYIKASAKNVGLKVKFVINNISFKELYNLIKSEDSQYDTIPFLVKNESRAKDYSFGKAYLSYPMMIITHKNSPYIGKLSDLVNKKVAIETGYLTNKWIKNDYPNINIVSAKNTKDALIMLNEEKVDAYVGNMAVASYMMVNGGLDNIKIAAPTEFGNIDYRFVAPKRIGELSSILSKGYNKITPSEHALIQQKWFSLQTVEKIDYKIVWQIIIISSIIILLFIFWNRKLINAKAKIEKTQKALEEKTKQLNDYLDVSTDYIWEVDKNSIYTKVSDKVEDILGYTPKQLIGKSPLDFMPENEKQRVEAIFKEIVSNETHIVNLENTNIDKNGRKVILLTNGIPIFKDGKISGYRGTAKDITKEKNKDILILEQSKMVSMGEMIANISHQWRQPLSIISTASTGMLMQKKLGVLDDKDFEKTCTLINENTQYLSTTIDTFRNFLKEDKVKKVHPIEEEISQAVSIVETSLKNNYIELKQNVDYSKQTNLNIVENELSQVIINIINNAKDIILQREIDNGIIELNLLEEPHKVIITIEDNGKGIPDDVLPRIFEPYFTTKHQSQGTGLGLHMSYKIVTESFKGKLYAKNTTKGAKLFIELPKD